jgi:hypothetical protein
VHPSQFLARLAPILGQVIGALSSCLMELQEDAWEAVSEPVTSASTPIAP